MWNVLKNVLRYSVQPREGIIVKGYGFFSFAKNIGQA